MKKFVVKLKGQQVVVAQGVTATDAAQILIELVNCSGWDYVIQPEDCHQL